MYWFRYLCLLILQSRQADRDADAVAALIRLNYHDVRNRLQGAARGAALDSLYYSLEGDFVVLKDLLDGIPEGYSIDRKLLTLNYHLMRVHFHIARKCSDSKARKALSEMTAILGFFASAAARESHS